MNHDHRGIAMIFNHEHFHNEKRRTGTNLDSQRLQESLKRFGFDVRVFDDLSSDEIEDELCKISELDHSKNDCILMVIMTHGGFGTVASFNKYYTIEDVFQHFTDKNCPSLKGKPRLFFIQACRGEKIDVGHVMKIDEERKYKLERAPFGVSKEENDAGPTVVETERIDSLHEPFNHEHYLIVRSTMPDYASFRDPVKGSWFIQSLCNELVCNGHHFDILTLLTSVNLAVQEYESNPNKEKQILTISSMLTKILIFDIKERKVRTESEEMD